MRIGRAYPARNALLKFHLPINWIAFQANGSLADTEAVDVCSIVTDPVKTATITLVDINGAGVFNASSLKWAWFDSVTPDLFVAPVDQGTAESTDGSAVMVLELPHTTKTSGQIGWLIVTDSDGTVVQSPFHRAFSGPVAVD